MPTFIDIDYDLILNDDIYTSGNNINLYSLTINPTFTFSSENVIVGFFYNPQILFNPNLNNSLIFNNNSIIENIIYGEPDSINSAWFDFRETNINDEFLYDGVGEQIKNPQFIFNEYLNEETFHWMFPQDSLIDTSKMTMLSQNGITTVIVKNLTP